MGRKKKKTKDEAGHTKGRMRTRVRPEGSAPAGNILVIILEKYTKSGHAMVEAEARVFKNSSATIC